MSEEDTVSDAPQATDQVDLSSVDPEQTARMIAQLSDEQLREGLSGPQREAILAEVFARMGEHFKPGSAHGVDAVVHWKITGRPDGGYDHWEVVMRDRECTATNEPQLGGARHPDLGRGGLHEAGDRKRRRPDAVHEWQAEIEGDLMFTTQIQAMFRLPG